MTLFAVTTGVNAQEIPTALQKLVGARGSSGETQLRSQGYEFVGGEVEGNNAYTYYREPQTNNCLQVTTADGRYRSLKYTSDADCERVANARLGITDEPIPPGAFKTVCGVIVDGKTYRYLCNVTNHFTGEKLTKTTLSYPDVVFDLVWLSDDRLRMESQGIKPQEYQYSTSEGETDIITPDKVYFYYSNPELAAIEVKNFQP